LGHWWPQILPDGDHVLFTAFSTPIEKSRIVVRSLRTGEQRTLVEGGTFGRYAASGHLLYARGETVLAVPFDAHSLTLTGTAVPVLEGVVLEPQNGISQYAVSASGALAFLRSASLQNDRDLVSVDRSGKPQIIRPNLRAYGSIRVSPEGKRIALALRDGGHPPDIWILSLDRGSMTRLTFGPASNFGPLWIPDGKRLLYVSERPVFDVYSKSADGTGNDEAVISSSNDKNPLSVTPDGKTLLMTVSDVKTQTDLWLLSLDEKKEAKPFVATPYADAGGAFSPNGGWVAYQSNESGKMEIYLRAYPSGGNRVQISTDGGQEPRWARNGKELFYRTEKKLMSVPMGSGTPGKPVALFEAEFLSGGRTTSYDVAPDGQHFYFLLREQQTQRQATVDVILNWFDELNRRVPAGKK
jgi:serine/threonine-protein kinase